MGPVLFLLILLSLLNSLSLSAPYSSDWESFHQYTIDYSKPYINDTDHLIYRFKVFQESLLRHKRLNEYESQNGGHATYGVNKFSDLTPEEFANTYLLYRPSAPPLNDKISTSFIAESPSVVADPVTFDWRDKNVLTSIKNQQKCGSCWAFSVVEVLESRLAIQTGQSPVSLSVQEVISCEYYPDQELNGCSGGALYYAFKRLHDEGRVIVSDSVYPFASSDGNTKTCRQNLPQQGVVLKEYNYTSDIDENVMVQYVLRNGPTSNSVNAAMWQDYSSGIIQHHCTSTPLDHAIQVIGYNLDNNPVPYWIVRNTWGSDWGEGGYVRLKFGENTCGLAAEVVTVWNVTSV
ncbi:PREDICTED: cathepsin O-like [Amphimedon queenslandica]|uniref:Uncharacterized protein n=1 Tax=Amphimedon queenslandica TaxID=400682 RepID=A0AAN0JNL3_AMPQE|nr:PREDICTED: cathepsin O-like [Amphimedon queenslandica]|eukprot:XP_019858627.1 PREDICTED: cathepsin O-like [Amphimedon queenslandica]